jgi:hypothetical protein
MSPLYIRKGLTIAVKKVLICFRSRERRLKAMRKMSMKTDLLNLSKNLYLENNDNNQNTKACHQYVYFVLSLLALR